MPLAKKYFRIPLKINSFCWLQFQLTIFRTLLLECPISGNNKGGGVAKTFVGRK